MSKINRLVPIILFALTASSHSFGDFSPTLRSGRPGQATGPFAVGKKVFQVESGIVQDGSRNSSQASNSTASSGNAVVRYGVTENIELNTGWGYRAQSQIQSGVSTTTSGIDTSLLGVRAELTPGDGPSPAVGMQFNFKANVGEGSLGSRASGANFTLAGSSALTDTFGVTVNLGPDWDGIDPSPSLAFVINATYTATPAVSLFLESYGSTRGGVWDTYFDGGAAYILNSDVQLDLYAGAGANRGVTQYFLSAGVSFRFPNR